MSRRNGCEPQERGDTKYRSTLLCLKKRHDAVKSSG
jgi:hypothetical protein